MSLPNWAFLVAYIVGGVWLLTWECLAAWADKEKGDTISEFTWQAISFKPLAFVLAGFLAWLVIHLLSKGRWA